MANFFRPIARASSLIILTACLTLSHAADPFSVSIINQLGESVDLWWRRPEGNMIVGSVEDANRMGMDTFVGHHFVAVAKGTYRTIKQLTITEGVTEYVLAEGSETCRAPSLPCKDRHPDCAAKARLDKSGCAESPGWMVHFCATTCNRELNACELLDPEIRCPRESLFPRHNISMAPAFKPNSRELRAFFDTLDEKWPQYSPIIVNANPPVAVLDTFLTKAEAMEMKRAVRVGSFKRSTTGGKTDETGYTEQVSLKSRTSHNAWCMHDCEKNPTVVAVTKRIEAVTGVPSGHYESFQMLRYQQGQTYGRHHDNSGGPLGYKPSGRRVLTFFLYLSDVKEGGSTEFTDLKPPLHVKPKMGRALVWPSVLDDMTTIHPLAWHRANPPAEGEEKFAANAWIHQYNYKIAQVWGCTGSFA